MQSKQHRAFFLLLFFSFLCIQTKALADVYKCEAQGKILLSQLPCSPEQKQLSHQEITQSADEKKTQSAIAQAEKEKSALKKMQQQRLKSEQKTDAEIRRLAAKAEKKKQQCNKAKLRTSWAKQDLDHAKPQAESKARQKFERSKQSADLICKAS